MKTLQVELGERSYPIYIGPALLERAELLRAHIASRQVLIVTNETIAPLYLDQVLTALGDYETGQVILPDGEEYKTWEVMNRLFDALLEKRFDRYTTLIALGGGVVGDITGFAAACYQRGVPFVQIPTTLLAQVDSSVGGKTAVNHRLGKNMIGAFYQPRAVIADTDTLNTLDDRQLRAGMAEVIKYGVIRDAEFFDWLDGHLEALLARDSQALSFAIERSCRCKAEIVATDEREAGQRALLNFGHTFGHAIETGAGYGVWLHGEAVAAGMCMASELSWRLGWLGRTDRDRIIDLIERAGLPIHSPRDLSPDRFMELMAVDKKVRHGRVRLVLLTAIGSSLVTDSFDPRVLRNTLEAYQSGAVD